MGSGWWSWGLSSGAAAAVQWTVAGESGRRSASASERGTSFCPSDAGATYPFPGPPVALPGHSVGQSCCQRHQRAKTKLPEAPRLPVDHIPNGTRKNRGPHLVTLGCCDCDCGEHFRRQGLLWLMTGRRIGRTVFESGFDGQQLHFRFRNWLRRSVCGLGEVGW